MPPEIRGVQQTAILESRTTWPSQTEGTMEHPRGSVIWEQCISPLTQNFSAQAQSKTQIESPNLQGACAILPRGRS
jgi:hypothetical protein